MGVMFGVRGGATAALAVLGMGLAGCSSSGSDGAATALDRYDALASEGSAIAGEMQGEVYSDPAALPTSGSASYEGVIGFNTNGLVSGAAEPYELQGDIALRMDFGDPSDPISGEATGFASSSDEYTGRLVVSESVLARDADLETEVPIAFALDGTLTAPDGEDLDIALGAAGAFSGDDVDEFDHAFGVVVGEGCDNVGCTNLEGEFLARRQ